MSATVWCSSVWPGGAQNMFMIISLYTLQLFPDTGTKGVARDMKKVCSGAQRDEGKTWFSELSDKGTVLWYFDTSVVVVVFFLGGYLQL